MPNKLTIEYVKQKLKKLHPGCELLSKDYRNAHIKLDIICEKGHEFKNNWDKISRGYWCSECSGNKKKTIEDVIKFINENYPGSKLLSKNYKNSFTKLDIICEKGHEFKSSWDIINNRHWCPECAGKKKKTIENIINFINENHSGSKLLSEKYENNNTKLTFICEKGHKFKSSWNNISNNKWCPDCGGTKKKTIEDIIKFINENHSGSKLLSKEYKNNNTKLDIICEKNHKFKSNWLCINNRGTWCPTCSEKRGEKLCREALQTLFNKTFPKTKPEWLINSKTNCLLELDCFCEELNLAFEYQGYQHYKYPNHYHKNKKQFEEQIYRDKIKKQLCKENNITLLCIKEFDDFKNSTITKNIFEELLNHPNILNCLYIPL